MTAKDGDLRRLHRVHLPMVHWCTIETGAISPGTPDSEGCWQGSTFWIEYKRTTAWAIRFKPEQPGWHLRRARAGGRSYVSTRRRRPDGTDELWVHAGADVLALKADGLRGAVPLLVCSGGPSRWDWAAVREVLVTGRA